MVGAFGWAVLGLDCIAEVLGKSSGLKDLSTQEISSSGLLQGVW
jgi:hypothetical protein